MNTNRLQPKSFVVRLEEPPVSRALFGEVRWAWIWLIVRLYVGWQWLHAALGKIGNPVWTGDQAGTALSGFVNGALEKTSGAHPDVQAWYAWFLKSVVLPNVHTWSYLVAFGELLVGIALILGLFTGIAAFFGSFMNMSYLLAGSVSSNPILLLLGGFLVLAWRTAGWWGLDRWVLPALGTPWRPGLVFERTDDQGSDQSRSKQEKPIPS
jgi:thiosulfate dehydrogenase [quinone] large subunit